MLRRALQAGGRLFGCAGQLSQCAARTCILPSHCEPLSPSFPLPAAAPRWRTRCPSSPPSPPPAPPVRAPDGWREFTTCGAALLQLASAARAACIHVVHPAFFATPCPLPAVEALRDMSKGALEQVPLQDYFK